MSSDAMARVIDAVAREFDKRADPNDNRDHFGDLHDAWRKVAGEEIERLRAALLVADGLIAHLYEPISTGEPGHPGEPCRRTHWIPQRRVDELWHAIVAWRDSWTHGAAGVQQTPEPAREEKP